MKKITRAFALTLDQIATIAKNFAADITQGLSGQESSLKLLPSFLTKPTGEERGSYLALDFGGTNVRTLLVTLSGQGQYQIEKNQSAPLTDPNSNIDLISADSNAEALFDFIALRLKDLLVPTATYELGHTFSFPCSQLDVNTAILLQWTKELKTPGVEGQNITQLLEKALKRHELSQITCRAVINDTVGTLLTAAYLFPQSDIGSILGTGHNTCYLEPHAPLTGKPMILNLESGNFDKLFPNCYDMQLDSESEKPGQQLLEKMVSGRYLGELVRLCLQDLSLRHPEILPECLFVVPYSLDTKELSLFLETRHLSYLSSPTGWQPS